MLALQLPRSILFYVAQGGESDSGGVSSTNQTYDSFAPTDSTSCYRSDSSRDLRCSYASFRRGAGQRGRQAGHMRIGPVERSHRITPCARSCREQRFRDADHRYNSSAVPPNRMRPGNGHRSAPVDSNEQPLRAGNCCAGDPDPDPCSDCREECNSERGMELAGSSTCLAPDHAVHSYCGGCESFRHRRELPRFCPGDDQRPGHWRHHPVGEVPG